MLSLPPNILTLIVLLIVIYSDIFCCYALPHDTILNNGKISIKGQLLQMLLVILAYTIILNAIG